MRANPRVPPVAVVGIGADGWLGLSRAAQDAVSRADVIVGSRRQLELISDHVGAGVELIEWPSPLLAALPGLFAGLAGRQVCALASGDPMFYGLGCTLCRMIGPERIEVYPHLSSVSLACARLRWPVQDVSVLSAVGRPLDRLRGWVVPGRRVLLLTPDADAPARVAKLLVEMGYRDSEVTVLEQLGGSAERVRSARASRWDLPAGDPLAVVAVRCIADPGTVALPRLPGLPDDSFAHDGQLTKREIRAITLARLAPLPGQLLWDVGAGSGSIGIEWLRAEDAAGAVAIERDPARAERIIRNAAGLGVPMLRVVTGAAPEALAGLDQPDAIFVGGGLATPGLLATCWSALRPGGRLVANAVTVQAETLLARCHGEHGGSLTRLRVERAEPLGGLTGWRPALPVTQWAADKP